MKPLNLLILLFSLFFSSTFPLDVFGEDIGSFLSMEKYSPSQECFVDVEIKAKVSYETREVQFFDKSTGDVDTWYWTFGDGNYSRLKDPVHVYDKPGIYLVALKAGNLAMNCFDFSFKIIIVTYRGCEADFVAEIDHELQTVYFTNLSDGDPGFFYWDFGNGKYSTEDNPVISYEKAGTYKVSLTVGNDDKSCMDRIVKEIKIGNYDCSAKFAYTISEEENIGYFRSQLTGEFTRILWLFGDGSYSTEINPVHEFPAPGTYSVGLNSYDANNSCMDYYEEKVLIGANPLIAESEIQCSPSIAYQPEADNYVIKFSPRNTCDEYKYLWNFGDREISGEIQPVHTYKEAGNYLVCLTMTNNSGTSKMICERIIVNPEEKELCQSDFMFSVDSMSGEVVFIENSTGETNQWEWKFGDGATSEERDPIHIYEEKGTYTVQLKSMNTEIGCKDIIVKVINVGDDFGLKAGFAYEALLPDAKKALGYPVDFVGASSGDGTSYDWDFGDEQIKAFIVMDSSSQMVRHYYSSPGIYRACLRVTNNFTGETDIDCQDVMTEDPLNIDPSSENEKIQLNVYPNPAGDHCYLKYKIAEEDDIMIAIYDALGRNVLELPVQEDQKPGEHTLLINTLKLSQGVYYVKILTKNSFVSKPLILDR